MLRILNITNLAIIEKLDLEMGPGLNVFSGETGAGKSIILDAVSLLVGGRADATWIRTGAAQARVEGVFVLPRGEMNGAVGVLAEYGIEPEGDEVILAREINLEGRNLCRVNGQIVPTKVLAALGETLVDIHGQGQHLSLFRVREHVDILDRYAGSMGLRTEVGACVAELRRVRQELGELRKGGRDAAQRAELLAFQVKEIKDARLRAGEEEELARERNLVANAERILTLTEQARQALSQGGDSGKSAADLLGEALGSLIQLEKLDPSLRQTRESVEALAYQAEEIARAVGAYREGIEFDPGRLQTIEERLDAIFRLKRKYGSGIPEILAFGERAATELAGLSRSESRTSELEARAAALLKRIGDASAKLSAQRKVAGGRLAAAVEKILGQLAMPSTRVAARIEQQPSEEGAPVTLGDDGRRSSETALLAFDATGVDRVELMMAANAGEALKPLARVASGGEASRLMLAIKVVLAEADRVPTLVFDEIDSGVGGRLGTVVGQQLWKLGRNHQVLCVTHLPQIASIGDRHFRVAKSVHLERTSVAVESMDGDARVREIGAMLGSSGAAALQNAREILAEGTAWKGGQTGTE